MYLTLSNGWVFVDYRRGRDDHMHILRECKVLFRVIVIERWVGHPAVVVA